jgi:transposase InsO family protein
LQPSLTAQSTPNPTNYAPVTNPNTSHVETLPWHGPPQANLAQASQATSPQTNNQIQYQYPQLTDYTAHLLLARASYINNKDTQKDSLSWILDSGATQHFCNSQSSLKDYKRFREPRKVLLGDDTAITADGSGTQSLQIGPYLITLSFWFVPNLAENLVSTRLLDQAGYSILIERDTVFIRKRDLTGADWHRLADARHGDLYRIHANQLSALDSPRALRVKEYSTLRMWHNRLGHRDFRLVGDLMNLTVPRQPPVCAACQQGRMKASPHPRVLERSSKPFECVHADLVPLEGISFGKSRHMLLLVDDYTRFAWTFFSSTKSVEAVSPLITQFVKMAQTQFEKPVKRWRTDGGTGEFKNSMIQAVNSQYGILHEFSTPGVKQQNGVVERRVQTIKDMEHSMRAGAGVLDDYRFQAESLAAANHIANILPSKSLDNCSPFVLLYGKQLPLDFIKPWGCLVYVHQRKEHRDKPGSGTHKPRCKPAMFVGYVGNSTSIYKCLDPITLDTYNYSELKFDEELFPGPWIKRPAGMVKSLAFQRNPPGSAVSAPLGQGPLLLPLPSSTTPSPPPWSVPFSSMNPFRMQPTHQVTASANITMGSPLPPASHMFMPMSGSRPVYNPRGKVVFGTCDRIHEYDQRNHVEAALIVQGLESLSGPPNGPNKDIRTDHNGDPLSFKDALSQDPRNWLPAIKEELQSHQDNGTWSVQEISRLPPGCKPIPGKWVFKRKLLPDGGTRYKARLVIRGFLQRYGIDFMETYAPTASLAASRLLVALAVFNGWSLRNLDIITAFLYGDIDSDVYMGIPEGMNIDPKRFILKLRRSLYGLKQAPRIWWERIHSFLLQIGFHCCDSEPAIFTRNREGNFVILLLFVDDILLTGTDGGIKESVKEITREFKVRDLGTPRLFLGIHVDRQEDRVILHQQSYIDRLLERFNAPKDPVATPLDPKQPLVEAADSELLDDSGAQEYRAAVGALIYLMICTRPDLAFSLSRLSKFVAKPGKKHAAALKRVLRYIVGTRNLGISFNRPSAATNPCLYGYSDSDFAADLNNRRSTSGFIFLLNGGPITWKSKQQSLVTGSTHDAEYVGLAIASNEVLWLRKLLLSILPDYTESTMPANKLYCDNQGAIATASQPGYAVSNRSKHIDVRFHIIREAAANGLVRLEYIRTTEMTADILTKALTRELHERHIKGLGMVRTLLK